MRVEIVYVPTPDLRGPDLDRIGTIEDVDPDVARVMLSEGSARMPDGEPVPAGALPVVHAQPSYALQPTPPPPPDDEPVDMSMTKAELLDRAAEQGVEVDSHATKADIIAAVEAAGAPVDDAPAE